MKNLLFGTIVLFALVVSACGASPATEIPDEMPATEVMMAHETPTSDAMMHDETATPEAMMESPAWYFASLSDVKTGQEFSIDSLKGKVVLVETMAVWCPKCLSQQEQIKSLHESLGQRDDFASISLDIDPNEDVAQLKAYVETQGFDWFYAVSPKNVSSEISSRLCVRSEILSTMESTICWSTPDS